MIEKIKDEIMQNKTYHITALKNTQVDADFNILSDAFEKKNIRMTARILPVFPETEDEEVRQEIYEYRHERAKERIRMMQNLARKAPEGLLWYAVQEEAEIQFRNLSSDAEYFVYIYEDLKKLSEVKNPDLDACIKAVCQVLKVCHQNKIYHKYIIPENIYCNEAENLYFLGRINILDDENDYSYHKIKDSEQELYDINMLAKMTAEINPEKKSAVVQKLINQHKKRKICYHTAEEILHDLEPKKAVPFRWGAVFGGLALVLVIAGVLMHQNASLGDADGNGTVNASDASLLSEWASPNYNLTEKQKKIGDVNRDGRVSQEDVALVRKYSVQKAVNKDLDFEDFLNQQKGENAHD